MIPRPKGMFTLGEEGSDADESPKRPSPSDLVGLQILIHRSVAESNVVAKGAVRASRPRASPASPGFLEACFLCHKELSPRKDVYMYRGDQGFCSVECRCRQILLDERRELEAATRDRLPSPVRLRAGHRPRESDRRGRTLAVA